MPLKNGFAILENENDPRATPGLFSWHDFSDFNSLKPLNGSQISQCLDKSGNNITLAQGTSANQLIYNPTGINGKSTGTLDGINDYISAVLSSYYTSNVLTVIYVAKRISVATESSVAICYNSALPRDFDTVDSTVVAYEGAAGTELTAFRIAPLSTATHPGNGVPYVFASVFDGSVNTVSLNGVAETPVASTGNFNFNTIAIGPRLVSTFTSFGNFEIGELQIYSRALSSDEVIQKSLYAVNKWGL